MGKCSVNYNIQNSLPKPAAKLNVTYNIGLRLFSSVFMCLNEHSASQEMDSSIKLNHLGSFGRGLAIAQNMED